MSVDLVSAHALFDEKPCAGPSCEMMVPSGSRLCRACVAKERRANGRTGAGHPPRGRFEARVARVGVVARMLDQAESDHRSDPSGETHAALLVAFREYRQAVRLLLGE